MSDYADYVEHPRYGRGPRRTGLDPIADLFDVRIHNAPLTDAARRECERLLGFSLPADTGSIRVIPKTGIAADPNLEATVPPTHYADLDCPCVGCNRRFIFFADEQRCWYEELGLPLEAFAVRCHACRAAARGVARTRARYEALYHIEDRGRGDTLEMAECCLELMEAGIFSPRQRERVRQLLNTLPAEERGDQRPAAIEERLRAYEAALGAGNP